MLEENGVSYAAITDHDLVTRVPQSDKVNLILASELTSSYNGRVIHILGYGVNESEIISQMCHEIRRKKKNFHMIKMYLMKKKEKTSNKNTDLLSIFVDNTVSTRAVIECINKAGWISILAHPTREMDCLDDVEELIRELKKYGLRGVECYHPSISQDVSRTLIEFSKREGLLISGGSDFHGDVDRNEGKVGVYIEEVFLHELMVACGYQK